MRPSRLAQPQMYPIMTRKQSGTPILFKPRSQDMPHQKSVSMDKLNVQLKEAAAFFMEGENRISHVLRRRIIGADAFDLLDRVDEIVEFLFLEETGDEHMVEFIYSGQRLYKHLYLERIPFTSCNFVCAPPAFSTKQGLHNPIHSVHATPCSSAAT